MVLTQAELSNIFGPTAEMCAGSFILNVDGVNQEVATVSLHTGKYTLSPKGQELVDAHAKPTTGGNKKPAKGGKDTPIASLELPGIPLKTVDEEMAIALAGLDLDSE